MEMFESLGFLQTRNMVRNMHLRNKEPILQHLVAFKMVVLGISKSEREKNLLEEDLHKMGYHSLLK